MKTKVTKATRKEISEVFSKTTPTRNKGMSFRFFESVKKEPTTFAVICSGIKKATERNKQKRRLRAIVREVLDGLNYKGTVIISFSGGIKDQPFKTLSEDIAFVIKNHVKAINP